MDTPQLTVTQMMCVTALSLFTGMPFVTAQPISDPSPPTATAEAAPSSRPVLTGEERELCARLQLDAEQIGELRRKPLHQFNEAEVHVYLSFLHEQEPHLCQRVAELARKNIGQPYELYLLGELPFEHYDPQPIYCLSKSDCLVFAEHTYAMALGHDWPSFMQLLQRIRYREGRISVVTRNHFTEADWNPANQWLVQDITGDLAAGHGIAFRQTVDRAGFLKKRYQLNVEIPVEDWQDVYIPLSAVPRIESKLQEGDFVNVVRGVSHPKDSSGGSAWVGHVGIIVRGGDGTVNMIHSAKPAVREEPLQSYIAAAEKTLADQDEAGKAGLLGFKFLRLREDALTRLRELDGAMAPQIHMPGASGGKQVTGDHGITTSGVDVTP